MPISITSIDINKDNSTVVEVHHKGKSFVAQAFVASCWYIDRWSTNTSRPSLTAPIADRCLPLTNIYDNNSCVRKYARTWEKEADSGRATRRTSSHSTHTQWRLMMMNIMESVLKNTNSQKVVKIWRMHETVYTRPFFLPLLNSFRGKGLGMKLGLCAVVNHVSPFWSQLANFEMGWPSLKLARLQIGAYTACTCTVYV